MARISEVGSELYSSSDAGTGIHCRCQQATKEMESTRIKGCLFFSDGFHSNRFCCDDGTEKEGCARTRAEMWEHRQQNAVRAIKSNERSSEPFRSC